MIKLFPLFLLLFSFSLSASTQRVALVIGNNNYKNQNTLYNPINDTKLITKQLLHSGFDVIRLENATAIDIKKGLKKFQKKLTMESIGLFYFAGHGVEIDSANYLVPIGANFEDADALKRSSLNISKIVRIFKESQNKLNIIILDACRDNPVNPLKQKGLAPFVSPDGLFVAYSAQSGEKALDGPKDGYSPFATALASNMQKNLDIEALFKATRIDVYNATKGRQRPSTYSEILSPFYFTQTIVKTRGLKRSSHNSKINYIRHKRFIEPKLVLIKAGSFTQGYDDDFDTAPAHTVTVKKDFYAGVYEVTFEEFDMFCKSTGWEKPKDNSWGRGKQPVINVSYTDALAYVNWLSKVSKKPYKLLSESQWEYIARSNSKSFYGIGNDDALLENYAWYKDNSNNHPHLIGTKKSNIFGLHDLLGNVAEITNEDYFEYSDSLEKDSNLKVIRGGAYYDSYEDLGVHRRAEIDINTRNVHTGFRILLEKEQ